MESRGSRSTPPSSSTFAGSEDRIHSLPASRSQETRPRGSCASGSNAGTLEPQGFPAATGPKPEYFLNFSKIEEFWPQQPDLHTNWANMRSQHLRIAPQSPHLDPRSAAPSGNPIAFTQTNTPPEPIKSAHFPLPTTIPSQVSNNNTSTQTTKPSQSQKQHQR